MSLANFLNTSLGSVSNPSPVATFLLTAHFLLAPLSHDYICKTILILCFNLFPVLSLLLSYQRPYGLDYPHLPHQRKISGKFGILANACCMSSHFLLNSLKFALPSDVIVLFLFAYSHKFFSSMLFNTVLENSEHRIHLNIYFLSHLTLSEKWTLFFKCQILTGFFQTCSQPFYHFQILIIHHH